MDGTVLVDNDINWAARAERATGCALGVDDFVYVHLGEGLGCAVVTDTEVRRGHHGLAGEIAHLYTAGPGARRCPSSRSSPNSACAATSPPPSTSTPCAPPPSATPRPHDGPAARWPARWAACWRRRSPWPTPG
ncbi:ROK family protein [Streptomyces sp. INA 01156]